MRLKAILSNSLTAVVGAIRCANIDCFWFKFRCKCTTAAYGGFLYITADDGDAEADEPDRLWRVAADSSAEVGWATPVKSFTEFRRAGEIEGLDFDAERGELVVLNNRGKRTVLGMPKGLYPGYDREIHEIYIYSLPKN
jgi:hypothetical protein